MTSVITLAPPVPVLSIRGLTVDLLREAHFVPVVRGIDLELGPGKVHALVGESGSGKTVTSFALLGLHRPPMARIGGSISLSGQELTSLSAGALRNVRGSKIAMVFQEPRKYLSPSMKIRSQLAEAVRVHLSVGRNEALTEVRRLLDEVELGSSERILEAYPHELSGGMCQRVMVAKALAGNPRVLVADEPTSALDASRRADIEQLFRQLAAERNMAVLFISHDLRSIARIADTVSVMYAGKIVERLSITRFRSQPDHPYTRLLRSSIPDAVHRGTPLQVIAGQIPGPGEVPAGCPFHPRCPYAIPRCGAEEPRIRQVPGTGGGEAACHRLEELWQFW